MVLFIIFPLKERFLGEMADYWSRVSNVPDEHGTKKEKVRELESDQEESRGKPKKLPLAKG